MEKNNKYAYLAKNTMLFTISSFGSKILSFLLVPLYTAVLSTEEYGTADLVTTTAGLLIYVFTLNIADAVLRFAIDRKNNQEEILTYGIQILLKGSCVFVFLLCVAWKLSIIDWPAYCYVFLFLNFFIINFFIFLNFGAYRYKPYYFFVFFAFKTIIARSFYTIFFIFH